VAPATVGWPGQSPCSRTAHTGSIWILIKASGARWTRAVRDQPGRPSTLPAEKKRKRGRVACKPVPVPALLGYCSVLLGGGVRMQQSASWQAYHAADFKTVPDTFSFVLT
jgi:hypothetical protein